MNTVFKSLEGGMINGKVVRVKLFENRTWPGHYQHYLSQEPDVEEEAEIFDEKDMDENLEKEVSSLNGITIMNKDLLQLADGIQSCLEWWHHWFLP